MPKKVEMHGDNQKGDFIQCSTELMQNKLSFTRKENKAPFHIYIYQIGSDGTSLSVSFNYIMIHSLPITLVGSWQQRRSHLPLFLIMSNAKRTL